jgi:hypothetical protein
VSDKSGSEDVRQDVDEVIRRVLSAKPHTAHELKKTVIERSGVSERTYFYHLNKLLKQGVIEEVSEKSDSGRLLTGYDLCRQQPRVTESEEVARSIQVAPYPARRFLLELAAWIKREPWGWQKLRCVEQARMYLCMCPYLVPEIAPSSEDPDAYEFIWSDEASGELRLENKRSSRFFDLKPVYDAIVPDLDAGSSDDCDVFLGVFWTPLKKPHAVFVGVCRRIDGTMGVVHVETREGKLEKSWGKGVGEQLESKSIHVCSYDSLKNGLKRRVLLNLRRVLMQHRLLIPNRYTQLIEELCDYSYMKSSEGHVLALALALDDI